MIMAEIAGMNDIRRVNIPDKFLKKIPGIPTSQDNVNVNAKKENIGLRLIQ
jgi:hypothetical protein